MAMLAAVARDPGGEDFLERGEGSGGQHAGSERVLLELGEIGLELRLLSFCARVISSFNAYREIALSRFSSCQPLAQLVHESFFAIAGNWSIADRLFLELHGHFDESWR